MHSVLFHTGISLDVGCVHEWYNCGVGMQKPKSTPTNMTIAPTQAPTNMTKALTSAPTNVKNAPTSAPMTLPMRPYQHQEWGDISAAAYTRGVARFIQRGATQLFNGILLPCEGPAWPPSGSPSRQRRVFSHKADLLGTGGHSECHDMSYMLVFDFRIQHGLCHVEHSGCHDDAVDVFPGSAYS